MADTPIAADAAIKARWLHPVEPDETLDNHAVVLRDGNIIDVLPNDAVETKYHAANTILLDKHIVIPGLVNCHTHAAMSLLRGFADDLPLMDWLQNHIWPAENKWISESFVEDGTRLAIAEMIRNGTTCFSDMYYFPDVAAKVSVECGMRAVIGLILLDHPTAWAEDPDEYFRKGLHVHDRFLNNSLIHSAFAPHAPYTVSDAPLSRALTLADELEVPIHIHLHETQQEIEESMARYQMRPLERLSKLGLLNSRLVAVHMTQLLPGEIEALAHYGCHVVHCPESNMKLASGFCPVQELSDAGVNVALGTDSAASNNNLDLLGELRCAALLAKAVAGNAAAMPASSAVAMATLNGAKALGLDHRIGSLVPGKAADITAVDLSQIETQPIYKPLSQLVYASHASHVSDVWIGGKRVLNNRELTTISEHQTINRSIDWKNRLLA